jgi:4-hydroxy-tetrahydrodipicolinate synthase
VEIARSEVPAGRLVVAGIAAGTAPDARAQVQAVAAAGADAVLLQAPASFSRGIAEAPEVALRFVREVAAEGMPVILFQHQVSTQRNYPLPLLLRLLEIENVVAVKETIWDVARYEHTVSAVRRERPDVQVLLANDTLLLPCMVSAPPDGLLLGFAALAGQQIGDMFRAVQAGDLTEARRLHDALAPLRDVIYGAPSLAYYPRVKAALCMLGVLPNRRVRSPLVDTGPEELEGIRAALGISGLL